MGIIKAADIILPNVEDMSKWSVIACDQFTSDMAYWEETEQNAADSPSTLNMILPEAWIGTEKAEGAPQRARAVMGKYSAEGVFRTLENSFVYVERENRKGNIRHGFIAAVDLEEYDYQPQADKLIKATENTVKERLYKRLDMRKAAAIEMPHVLVFIDDKEDEIIGGCTAKKASLKKEYEFDLMQGGGHITGWAVSGDAAAELQKKLDDLQRKASENSDVAGGKYSVMLAVGDGNHSLATAKLSWDILKEGLTEDQRTNHPARWALVELINVYDSGIDIEPIHRVIKNSDVSAFSDYVAEGFRKLNGSGDGERLIKVGTGGMEKEVILKGLSVGEIISAADRIIEEYIAVRGGEEDYIHDEASAKEIGSGKGCGYILLPTVRREDIFTTVRSHAIFPKKSFSIGSAREKRYYLECRRITAEE